MEDISFDDELQCLKASYDPSELKFSISSHSPILTFYLQHNMAVTFEVPPSYPQNPPSISLSSTELTNCERSTLETELRDLANKSIGFPMIMDLVTKLQQLVEDYHTRNTMAEKKQTPQNTDSYIAIILIDHMRQKKRYSDLLASWASELNVVGCLLFYQKWIFLILGGSKKHIKEFMMRHRTVCVDVDSSGKPCKEKMSKILYESKILQHLPAFSVKEMTTVEEIENFFAKYNIFKIFKDVIKPALNLS